MGRGGQGNADEVKEVAEILYFKSVLNADKEERVKNSKILRTLFMEDSLTCLKVHKR